jgi:hypothetical protein
MTSPSQILYHLIQNKFQHKGNGIRSESKVLYIRWLRILYVIWSSSRACLNKEFEILMSYAQWSITIDYSNLTDYIHLMMVPCGRNMLKYTWWIWNVRKNFGVELHAQSKKTNSHKYGPTNSFFPNYSTESAHLQEVLQKSTSAALRSLSFAQPHIGWMSDSSLNKYPFLV